MLTKDDLEQIEEIVDKKTEPRFTKIEKTLQIIKKDIKDLIKFVKFFDTAHQHTRRRVAKIEDHLNIGPAD